MAGQDLLATTGLTAVSQSSATPSVLNASLQAGGGFGTSSATATALAGVTQIIQDVSPYTPGYVSSTAVRSYFSLQGITLSGFQLTLVTSRIYDTGTSTTGSGTSTSGSGTSTTGSGTSTSGSGTSTSGSGTPPYSGPIYAARDVASGYTNADGTVSLPQVIGAANVAAQATPDLVPTAVSVDGPGALGFGAIPTPDLDPILTVYDANWQPLDVITVTSGDNVAVSVSNASLTALNFSIAAPFNYTVNLSATAACFASGTRIATARGDVPIEALEVGDIAITADGSPQPIIWIGQRTVECTRHPRPQDVMPVCVVAGAFGDLPVRDLLLSPDHALLVDGALIPVRYLLNGATIRQQPVPQVTYWHVELPRHGIVLAEQLPAESYLDTGNRHAFSNGGPVVQMHPEFARAIWADASCAPLVTDGPALLAARQALDAQARALGYTPVEAPDLHVMVDKERIDPVAMDGGWCFNLAQAGRVQLCSSRAIPAETDPASDDWRHLGVAVRRLRFNGQDLVLDGPALGLGWLDAEPGWRWTVGAGELCLDGIGELLVELALAPRAWLPPISGQRCAALG